MFARYLLVRIEEDIVYIEDRDLWTTKEVWPIGHGAWHFRRNFASPSPSPYRDKTTDLRSMDHLIVFKKKNWKLFSSNRSIWAPKDAKFYAFPNPKAILKKMQDKKVIVKKLLFATFWKITFDERVKAKLLRVVKIYIFSKISIKMFSKFSWKA